MTTKPSTTLTKDEYIREFLCHVEQYTNYIDDAVNCAELADFSVINAKTATLRHAIPFIEGLIGIHRKERTHASRAQSPTSKPQVKDSHVPKGPTGSQVRTRRSGSGAPKTRSR